jgi:tetratricopeptide (TPR) repeat protein
VLQLSALAVVLALAMRPLHDPYRLTLPGLEFLYKHPVKLTRSSSVDRKSDAFERVALWPTSPPLFIAAEEPQNQGELDRQIDVRPGDGPARLQRASLRLQRGDSAGAIADLKELIRHDPNHPHGHGLLGMVLLTLAKPNEALPHFLEQRRRSGDTVDNLRRLGLCYTQLRRFKNALSALDEAVKRDWTSVPTLIARADARVQNGDIRGAIADAETATRLEPENTEIQHFLGEVYLTLGDAPEEAGATLNRAIELDPDDPMSHALRGVVWAQLHDPENARRDFDHALDLAGRRDTSTRVFAMILIRRGHLNRAEARWDEAIKDYQDAQARDPSNDEAAVGLGLALAGKSQFEAGRNEIQRVVDRRPDFPAASVGLANTWLDEGKPEQAIDVMKALVKRVPQARRPRYRLGLIEAAAGRHEEAIGEYNWLLEQLKSAWSRSKVLHARGQSRYELARRAGENPAGEVDRAIGDFTEAIKLLPRFPSSFPSVGRFYFAHRADAYLLKRDFLRAALDATAVIALDPRDPRGYQLRREARTGLHDEAGASEDEAAARKLAKRDDAVSRDAAAPLADSEPFSDFVIGPSTIRRFNFETDNARLDDRATLNRWLRAKQPAPDHPRPKLVVVAASGGGIAAAYWTTRCLCYIEDAIPRFPYHVRVITGGSGGMVGAGFYAASLTRDGEDRSALRLNALVRAVGEDSLSPVVREMVARDLLYGLRDVRRRHDRGRSLERAWVTNARRGPEAAIAEPLQKLAQGEWEGWRPSLIIAPTLAAQGRPLLISNLRLGALGGGLELFTLIPSARRLATVTALRLNAAFPYVTPDVPLPTDPPLQPVDAGFLDNDGVTLATDWIQRHRSWLKSNTSGVALIRIRTYRSLQRDGPTDTRRPQNQASALDSILRPLSAYDSSKLEVMLQQHASRIAILRRFFNGQDKEPNGKSSFFFDREFLADVDVPLSWTLASRDRDQIDEQAIANNQNGFGELKNFMERAEKDRSHE